MALALFDLDHTLLDIDSDHEWGVFLVKHQLVDAAYYQQRNDDFYQQYIAGTLDATEYNQFVFEFLARHERAQLAQWHQQFMAESILPHIRPQGLAAIARHQAQGDTLILITATNAFVTAPIAAQLGFQHLLATRPATVSSDPMSRFSGEVAGIPCFRDGKLAHLDQWLTDHPDHTLENSTGYSDSFNDLPLLERVTYPVAVSPDARLTAIAQTRGWPVVDWRIAV